MLNIGKLSPGAADYYVGEVATSAEDYYMGRGEAKGRWVGSLRPILGLGGEVDPEDFRAVLSGRHPATGVMLITSQGSAGRAASKRRDVTPSELELEAGVDTARAAAYLGYSHQHVRRLVKAGVDYRTALAKAGPDVVVQEPRRYLLGEKVPGEKSDGKPTRWQIPRSELVRYSSDRPSRKPRPGYDVTLRPPKSVSVLWALTDDRRRVVIRQAHTDAVDEVVRYMEARAIRGRVSTNGHQRLVETDGLIAAAFDHRTSRAGDPLLHTHVVVANMTRVDTANGPGWRAIAARGLFEHGKAAGFLYQAHLRHLLTERLGVKWGVVVNGHADITGVPDAVIDTFSKRRAEIDEVLAESGSTSARSAQIATLETRKPKNYDVDPDTLYETWRKEAAEAGFGAVQVEACFGRSTPEPLSPDEVAASYTWMAGPDGLTQRTSTFRRSEVIEALSARSGAACTAKQIETHTDAFLASTECVVVDRTTPTRTPAAAPSPATTAPDGVGTAPKRRKGAGSTQVIYTTADLAAIEEELLGWVSDTTTPITPALHGTVIEGTLGLRPELSREQASMLRAVCAHDVAVLVVSGRPGAGKTYAVEAVVAAHVTAGIPVVGCAVSASAAAELESAAGFTRSNAPATTVTGLLLDLDRWHGLAAGSVVIVDEASMLSTRDLHRVVAHARAAGGSVVLIGDPDQHGPVQVGGAFQRLCHDRGDALVTLVDNNRQVSAVDRLAIDDYRDGHIGDALARLDNAGRIVRSATAGESFDAMVADWYADRIDGHADPMIAGPNSTRRALNERARNLLKANSELVGEPITVAGREFLVGEQVVARRNDRRLHGGDRSRFVKNGSTGTVTHIRTDTGDVTVEFDKEGPVRVPNAYLVAGRLEYGYARTSYGVQGSTHGTGRYHPTDISGFEEGYVAITRGRDANRVYIVDGTITPTNDEEAHRTPESQRFDLDDVVDTLTRRRTGMMASDNADQLTVVHALATSQTLRLLGDTRHRLETVLADAPPDETATIATATQDLESLQARRQLWSAAGRNERLIAIIDRAVTRTETLLTGALDAQERRVDWSEAHIDTVNEHDQTRRAERHRRSKISENPHRYLPADVISNMKPEPVSQGERRIWHATLVQRALSHDKNTTHVIDTAGQVVEAAIDDAGIDLM